MDWNDVEGKWNQVKGKVREEFGRLTDDDLEQSAGKRDRLIGRLQDRYGYSRSEAERRLDQVASSIQQPDQDTSTRR